jgi:hypothetical protein
MDQKGYVMAGTSFLLLIPVILISVSLINFFQGENEIITQSIHSEKLSFAAGDIKRNIPILAREAMLNISLSLINDNKTINNSTESIKTQLQLQINDLAATYNNQNMNVSCNVDSIETSPHDPFLIEFDFTLNIKTENLKHEEKLSRLVSIEGMPDPLPFLKCRSYGSINHDNTKIFYGTSLSNYLESKNIDNSSYYENASSPFIIKKCPYEPYQSHGSNETMKNCQSNGFYHYSKDGSCYLCRLESKETCEHFGLEVFLQPVPVNNSNYSIVIDGPCSSDHVIFGIAPYTGHSLVYDIKNETVCFLFLDEGHGVKYGIN